MIELSINVPEVGEFIKEIVGRKRYKRIRGAVNYRNGALPSSIYP